MARIDNLLKFHDLRKEFPFLSYDSYRYSFSENSLNFEYTFNLSGKYFFTPRIFITLNTKFKKRYQELSTPAVENLVFHIGLIELISYWKAACPLEVRILPHSMTNGQLDFWKKIYWHGLGEFFYLNSIDTDRENFMNIKVSENQGVRKFNIEKENGSIVPVGGGKDSAVTLGLLQRAGMSWVPLSINPTRATMDVIKAAGKIEEEAIVIRREIHPKLLELNKMGFLNGHTPFSALLGFYSLLVASLTGITDIVLSNESSANEATVPGTSINHQYSKSLQFEEDFRKYIKEFISEDLNYFSLLRPLSELQIAGLFAGMEEFHAVFRSCNAGSRQNQWCGHCPKCLFTYIILSPFLEPDQLVRIFGKNLLEDESLTGIMEQLNGRQEVKPFECIGTVDEVNIALDRAIEMYKAENLPLLLKLHLASPGQRTDASHYTFVMEKTDERHFVPEDYKKLLPQRL